MNEKLKNAASPPLLMRQMYHSLEILEKYPGDGLLWEWDIPNLSIMAIIMTVTCVEVFLNMFFRIIVEETRFNHLKEKTIKEMESTRFGLESKIRKWPERFFHKNFINSKAGKEFIKYKKIRNDLVHYQATCKEIAPLPIPFNKYGVTDTSIFNKLEYDYVQNSKKIVKGVIEEMFKLSGHLNSHSYFEIDNWTGENSNK